MTSEDQRVMLEALLDEKDLSGPGTVHFDTEEDYMAWKAKRGL